jgi:hypothetical protein
MNEMTPEQEIAFIKKVMQDSRKIFFMGGSEFIFWGIIIVICLIYTYFSYYHFDFHSADPSLRVETVWGIFVTIGILGNIFIFKKKRSGPKVSSFAGKLIGITWLAVGIAMMLVGFVGSFISGAIHGVFISPLMCSFLGASYMLTGVIAGKKWLSYLSIGWWTGAIIMFFYPGLQAVLIMAVMMILFQILPGIILQIEFKHEFAKTE